MRKFLLSIVTLVAILSSCNDDVAREQNGLLQTRGAASDTLAVNASFIKLEDDSTTLDAGVLEITSMLQEDVSIKWNVLPEFNIDTTTTTLQITDGKALLPIRWKNCLKSHNHGPQKENFEGGVIVIAGNKAKYIRLCWAERIDSTAIMAAPIIMNTPDAPYPAPRALYTEPRTLQLRSDGVEATMYVETGGERTSIGTIELSDELNIDIPSLVGTLN